VFTQIYEEPKFFNEEPDFFAATCRFMNRSEFP
jgi:hypothetical protein